MGKFISFLAYVPFVVYFLIPLFILLSHFVTRKFSNGRFIKIWAISFSILSVLSSFILSIISSQAELAFSSGRLFLTEPLSQLALAVQVFGVFNINSIYKLTFNSKIPAAIDDCIHKLIKTMILTGLVTYIIYSNQFLSTLLSFLILLVLSPLLRRKSKIIWSGVILFSFIFLNFLGLDLLKTFSEIRILVLSGEVDSMIIMGFTFFSLIFYSIQHIFNLIKTDEKNVYEQMLWIVFSPIVLLVSFYRLIQIGFISSDYLTYNLSQWFVVMSLIIILFFSNLKAKSLFGVAKTASSFLVLISIIMLLSGVDDFALPLSAVHFCIVAIAIVYLVLHFIIKLQLHKNAKIMSTDLSYLLPQSKIMRFITYVLILFLIALPPSPLFLILFSGFEILIENGLYWLCSWTLILFSLFGYKLLSLTSYSKSNKESQKALELWKSEPVKALNVEFIEILFICFWLFVVYLVAFLNL